jgi:hypothetical protein
MDQGLFWEVCGMVKSIKNGKNPCVLVCSIREREHVAGHSQIIEQLVEESMRNAR